MAKKKGRIATNNGTGDLVYERHTLSSGVVVKVYPFPPGLWGKVNTKAIELFPDPEVPLKDVPTFDGSEKIEDYENPEYKRKKQIAGNERGSYLTESILKFAVEVEDFEQYEDIITDLEELNEEPYPTHVKKRQVQFLIDYGMRTKDDYSNIFMSSIEQMTVEDEAVNQRLDSFRNKMEGSKA